MAYYYMLQRDADRLVDVRKRVNVMPLGACAIAGTSLPIDRLYVAKLLNFPKITKNSIDTVSDRDFIIEYLATLSIIAMHLSRLSEDLVLWSSPQYEFIEFDDSYCTGSSSLPQKKNPDVAEIIRGKTGRVYGDLMGILTIMKGLPLSYNRDMQEDKKLLFDAVDTVKECLTIYPDMLKTMKINKEKMKKAVMDHFSWAADFANTLEQRGYSWRDAYVKTAKFILTCVKKGISLSQYSYDEIKQVIESPISKGKNRQK
jgi:argininosuccinate lyase